MKLGYCILVAAVTALVFAATGCSGNSSTNNPTGSASADPTYDTPLPYGGQGHPNPQKAAAGGGSSGSAGGTSGGSGFNLPQSPGGVAMILIAIVLLLVGVYLIKEGKLRWGVPILAGGLALVVWRIGTAGLHANFLPWNWHLVVWILILAWTAAKVTGFTKIDDWVVTGGSLGMLVLSFVGRGILGSWNPFSSAWWILECIWVFLVAEAIWKSDYFRVRRFAQFLALAGGWYLLGVLS